MKMKGEQNGNVLDLDAIEKVLAKERAQYDAKKEAFEGLEGKLEQEFRAGLDASLNEDERDIMELGGDVGAQYDLIMEKRNAFVGERLSTEKMELEVFEEELGKKETQLDDLRAESTFKEGYPDLDEESFIAFLKGQIKPDDREEMIKTSEGDRSKFLGLAAEKFLESTGTRKDEDPDLPTDISGIPGETGDIDSGDNVADENDSFAADSGLYR